MPPKLSVEHVSIDRRTVSDGQAQTLRILSDVSFEVPAGGRLALFGPSGSGKTSLLRLLNRLDDPAEGRVLLDGQDLRTLDPLAMRRRVGMLFQHPFLLDVTVEENLRYPLRLQRQTLSRESAAALLDEFGLPAAFLDRQSGQLSIGQQQRVSLARALVLAPEVLLLDEPTSALDEESARLITDALLHRNATQGLTLVMVTHSREVLGRLDAPVVIVNEGVVRYYTETTDALRLAAHEKVELE